MTWEIEKQSATAKTDSLAVTFDASKPYRGLAVKFGDSADPVRLFSFLLSEPPIEQYVRENDLVSKYPARNSDLVSYTTYYRLSEDGRGIDFILSAQTSLLDSAPLTQVVSEFADSELLFKPETTSLRPVEGEQVFPTPACPQFFLIRPQNQPDHSIVLMIHPTDFHRGNVRLDPVPTVSLSLFPNALEKGVIRRGTLKIQLVDRANDEATAEKLYDELEAAAPPLTA